MRRAVPIDIPSAAVGAYVGLLGYAGGTLIGVDRSAVLVTCAVGWLVATLALGRRPDVWATLGRRRLLSLPTIVPAIPGLILVYSLEVEWLPSTSLTRLGWVVALFVVGVIIWTYGNSRYAELVAGDRVASWTATLDPACRRRRTRLVVLGALGSVGYFIAGLAYGLPSVLLGLLVSSTIGQWIRLDRSRTYDVHERGLQYSQSGAGDSQFLPWTRFARVIETADAIVLERRWWFDIRMDADDVPPSARETLRTSIDLPYHRWDH